MKLELLKNPLIRGKARVCCPGFFYLTIQFMSDYADDIVEDKNIYLRSNRMSRTITYAVDKVSGMIFSRVGQEVAIPILDFEGMTPENHFQTTYNLEKFSIYIAYQGTDLVWTKKISNAAKNVHREFWNMKPLVGKNRWEK